MILEEDANLSSPKVHLSSNHGMVESTLCFLDSLGYIRQSVAVVASSNAVVSQAEFLSVAIAGHITVIQFMLI